MITLLRLLSQVANEEIHAYDCCWFVMALTGSTQLRLLYDLVRG